jgi:two-component system, OmpR family, sensor kinase
MRRRLILGSLYLLLVVVVGLSVPFGATLGQRLTQELGGRVEREAYAVGAAVEDRLETGIGGDLQPLAEAFGRQIGGRVLITDAAGLLLADSLQPPGPTPPSYASRPEIAAALAGTPNWEVRPSASLGYALLVSAVPVRSSAGILGSVRISYPTAEVGEAIHRAWLFLAAIGLVAILIGLTLAVFLARWAIRPLKSAGSVARRIADGDLEARVPESGPPEVQELARDLNVMTDRLADRIRADREFAGNAAHQLRTPLAALRLSLEEARDGPDPRAEVGHALDETDRLGVVIDSLLELASRRERGVDMVDLAHLARSVVAEAVNGAGPQVRVTGVGSIVADPSRVRQVVANLVDNARRHARTVVRVTVSPNGSHIVLRVEDDGPGVPEEERTRLFDRFYRGYSPLGSGSGLGLAVAKDLAETDGGTIIVDSSDLGGARFEVRYAATGSRGRARFLPREG